MKSSTVVVLTAILLPSLPGCDGSHDSTGPALQPDGGWSAAMAPGSVLEIKGIGGDIRAAGGAGPTATVTWTIHGVHSDETAVRVDVVEHTGGVTVCAVYPDVPGRASNECVPGAWAGNMSVQDNDVEVDFVVTVPSGVEFAGRTVAGIIEASDLTAPMVANAVSGRIDITTASYASASTTAGSITARLGSGNWSGNIAFTAVTGDVFLEIPASTSARVSAFAANGNVSSDFDLTESWGGRLSGTLGNGGRTLNLSTVNGSVTLRRGR